MLPNILYSVFAATALSPLLASAKGQLRLEIKVSEVDVGEVTVEGGYGMTVDAPAEIAHGGGTGSKYQYWNAGWVVFDPESDKRSEEITIHRGEDADGNELEPAVCTVNAKKMPPGDDDITLTWLLGTMPKWDEEHTQWMEILYPASKKTALDEPTVAWLAAPDSMPEY